MILSMSNYLSCILLLWVTLFWGNFGTTLHAQSGPLRIIEGGTYIQGCTPGLSPCNAIPAGHNVRLTGFAIGVHEVTQAAYASVMGENPSFNNTCPNCPVERVSWYDALRYCNQRSLQEGLPPAYYADAALTVAYTGQPGAVYWDTESTGYRLPTEAEWEYAARAGMDTRYAGSDDWEEVAVAGSGTAEVGTKQPNAFGLYDLSGNVSEWCWDWNAPYPGFEVCDPRGASTGTLRSLRGGSYNDAASQTVASRSGQLPEAAASTIGFRVVRSVGLMQTIAGGTFTMGCTPEQGSGCQNDEFPPHTVTVDDFQLARYEVTQGEWAALVPEYTPFYNRGEGERHPTYRVSWYDAATYCNRRSLAEGLEPAYYFDPAYTEVFDSLVGDQLAYVDIYWKESANGYRFPTEAEWEYAARGGNQSGGYRYAGSNDLGSVAWYDANGNTTTHPVGQKAPNELGLYDMTGNIYEWCWDWYDDDYYSVSPTDNPKGPNQGTLTCIRGGSWISSADGSRVANRLNFLPGARRTTFAFRLARNAN